MAIQVVPSHGILSLTNLVVESAASLISVTSQASLYPGSNLLIPLRSKRWRSTGVASNQTIAFDLGTTYKPTIMALVDCNLQDIAAVTLQSSSAADFSANLKTYTYFSYAQAWNGNRVVRFFVGEPDSGASASHQYWRVTLTANTQKAGYSYFELGNIWLGTYTEADIDLDLSIDIEDDSEVETAYNGARYPDAIKTIRTVGVALPLLDLTTLYGLKDKFDLAGSVKHILIDIFANTGNAAQKPHGTFYGTVGSKGASIIQELQMHGTLEFSLEEAIG